MTKTYSALLQFINEANNLQIEDSKFKYAVEKVKSRIVAAIKTAKCETEYQEKVQDARIDHASVDKEGNLLKDGNNYKFTKEEEKKLLKKMRELGNELNETEIEIEPYISTDIPELNYNQVEAFTGLVIPENYTQKESAETINQNGQ